MTEQEIADAAARIPPARLLEMMGYEPKIGVLVDGVNDEWRVYPFGLYSSTKGKGCIVFDL